MARYKSPLRYPGGKAILAPIISSLIENNGYSDLNYAEPFAGGAGAALDLLFSERIWKIYLNDADYHLYAFWYIVINDSKKLCERIKTIPLTVAQWRKQKKIFNDIDNHSLFDIGFSTFYLNRTNRSGILDGAPIGGYDQNGRWKISARFNRKDLISRIQKISTYKTRIHISNMDAKHFLEYLNDRTEKIFIYLDPPYFKQGPELYLNYYDNEDHAALALYIQKELRHPWILTYDNIQNIIQLYKEQKYLTFTLSYHAGSQKTGKELLFFSPMLTNVPTEINVKKTKQVDKFNEFVEI